MLAYLESAYSLICGTHRIWGYGSGRALAFLWSVYLINKVVIGGNLAFVMAWWEASESDSSMKISIICWMVWELFQGFVQEMVWGNGLKNIAGIGLGNSLGIAPENSSEKDSKNDSGNVLGNSLGHGLGNS